MADPVSRRAAALEGAARDALDLLVIGGGINGVGILLDAVSRGMRALLVERDDLAAGTSSRSSKLIHGGLRYLERYRFGLVREALEERATLMRLAPHLVQLRRFVVPVTGSWWQTPYVAAGLSFYDLLGGRRGGRFRHLGPEALRRLGLPLRLEGVRGGFVYSDGVTDDARYVVAVARTAEALGGQLVTQAQVTDFSSGPANVRSVELLDRLEGRTRVVKARAVVDATGASEVDDPLFVTGETLRPSRGSHLVLRRGALPGRSGLTLRVPGRVVFVVPWFGFWILGTTDVAHEGDVRSPRPAVEEVDYLLRVAGEVLETPVGIGDVVGGFAGIRPLVGTGGGPDSATSTSDLSREHRIAEPTPGLFAVRGGKFTTYRIVAAEAVDRVAAYLGRTGGQSPTADIALVGAAPLTSHAAIATELVARGIDPDAARSLVRRYGTEALSVGRVAIDLGLESPMLPGLPYLGAEAWWAVHREHALTVEDVLARRTRAAIQDPEQAVAAAPFVSQILGEALSWSARDKQSAVQEYVSSSIQYRVPVREPLATVAGT